MRTLQSLDLRMVRPGRRPSDILHQVPVFDAAGGRFPGKSLVDPNRSKGKAKGGRNPLAGRGLINRQVAQEMHRIADEQSRAAVGRAFVTSQGMTDSKGRGRSMHQEVRHHLGGK